MPFKNPQKRLEYWKQYSKGYYSLHRADILAHKNKDRVKARQAWRKWHLKQVDKKRRTKISLGQIYTPKTPFTPKNPYS